MAEAAAAATISPDAQAAKLPPAEHSRRFPADTGPPTATPAPSSQPTKPPAPTRTAASAAQPLEATPQESVAQPAAPSDPSTTASPATASAQPIAPSPPAAAGHQQSGSVKKRKLEKEELQNSTYFKIRAVVRDLRPVFLEVLQAPDFRNCKAADDIRMKMKVLLNLSKQLRNEAVPPAKKTTEGQPLVEDGKQAVENHVEIEKQVGADGALANVPNQAGKAPSTPEEVVSEARGLEKQLQAHQGTYVIGGSPMGWNFLVYRGSEPVYYGVTKEASRARRSAT